jgi:hypothetical protein
VENGAIAKVENRKITKPSNLLKNAPNPTGTATWFTSTNTNAPALEFNSLFPKTAERLKTQIQRPTIIHSKGKTYTPNEFKELRETRGQQMTTRRPNPSHIINASGEIIRRRKPSGMITYNKKKNMGFVIQKIPIAIVTRDGLRIKDNNKLYTISEYDKILKETVQKLGLSDVELRLTDSNTVSVIEPITDEDECRKIREERAAKSIRSIKSANISFSSKDSGSGRLIVKTNGAVHHRLEKGLPPRTPESIAKEIEAAKEAASKSPCETVYPFHKYFDYLYRYRRNQYNRNNITHKLKDHKSNELIKKSIIVTLDDIKDRIKNLSIELSSGENKGSIESQILAEAIDKLNIRYKEIKEKSDELYNAEKMDSLDDIEHRITKLSKQFSSINKGSFESQILDAVISKLLIYVEEIDKKSEELINAKKFYSLKELLDIIEKFEEQIMNKNKESDGSIIINTVIIKLSKHFEEIDTKSDKLIKEKRMDTLDDIDSRIKELTRWFNSVNKGSIDYIILETAIDKLLTSAYEIEPRVKELLSLTKTFKSKQLNAKIQELSDQYVNVNNESINAIIINTVIKKLTMRLAKTKNAEATATREEANRQQAAQRAANEKLAANEARRIAQEKATREESNRQQAVQRAANEKAAREEAKRIAVNKITKMREEKAAAYRAANKARKAAEESAKVKKDKNRAELLEKRKNGLFYNNIPGYEGFQTHWREPQYSFNEVSGTEELLHPGYWENKANYNSRQDGGRRRYNTHKKRKSKNRKTRKH